MNNQTVVVEETLADLDLSFFDDLDSIINEDASSNQEVIDDGDVDLLMSALDEVESDDELADMYAAQESDPIIEIPQVVSVAGEEEPILAVAVSAALGEEEAATPKVHRVRATSPSSRILSKLGADAVDYATLTPDCSSKSDEELLEDFSKTVDAMAMYVSDKAVNLFSFLKTGGGLNGVTLRGFEVLLKDGQLVGGKDGNIVQNLLTKPYSQGTANSQSNQLIQLFTDLKIGTRATRGTLVANPDSVILDRVKTILGK